jgi:Fasciclin domain
MADPKALADMLRRYIVPGYYPYGSLSPAPVIRGFHRTVTNLRGEQLRLSGDEHDVTINGESMAEVGALDPVIVASGVRVITVAKLLPAAE